MLEGVERILSIELLIATQALDLRLAAAGPDAPSPGVGVAEARSRVRAVVAHLEEDREPGPDLAAAFELVHRGASSTSRAEAGPVAAG